MKLWSESWLEATRTVGTPGPGGWRVGDWVVDDEGSVVQLQGLEETAFTLGLSTHTASWCTAGRGYMKGVLWFGVSDIARAATPDEIAAACMASSSEG